VNERLLTAAEAAELLAVPESWVPEHTSYGTLPRVELGRYVRYRRDAILAWAEARQAPAPHEPTRSRWGPESPRPGPASVRRLALRAAWSLHALPCFDWAEATPQPGASLCPPSGAVAQSPRPEGAENHWRMLAHALESLSVIPRYATAAADMPEATGSRISLEIQHDRIYEPYARLAASLPRERRPATSCRVDPQLSRLRILPICRRIE
jgi:excisionase family DNA binding protein